MPLRRKRTILVVAAALLFLAPVAAFVAVPFVGARMVRRALPSLEARIGRPIHVGDVRVGFGQAELDDLDVDGAGGPSPIKVPRVRVEFGLWSVLGGHVEVSAIHLDRPTVQVVRSELGQDNISTILDKLNQLPGAPTQPATGGHLRGPRYVTVSDGDIDIADDTLGTLHVKRFTARLDREGPCRAELADAEVQLAAGPRASVGNLVVEFRLEHSRLAGLPSLAVDGGAVVVWKGFALSGITGGVTPDPADGARSIIDLKGGYGGVARVLWDAKGWVRPSAREAELTLDAARFDLGQLKPILAGTPIIDPEKAQVDARLVLHYHPDGKPPAASQQTAARTVDAAAAALQKETAVVLGSPLDDVVDFDGRFRMAGLSVFHPMLGPSPVRDLGFEATARGALKPRRRSVRLESAEFDFRGIRAELTAYAEKLGKKPAFDAWLVVPPVPCQSVLDALPTELTPALQGFKLQGTFKTQLHLAVDLSDLEQGVDLGGAVGIDGCKVLEAPDLVSADRLLGEFDHVVEVEPGVWQGMIVGPDNPDFVPFDQISPNLVNSIMTTEDSAFMKHHGFITSEFKTALKANLENGYFRFGASSITMQMVKNVLLSREKTLSRKLQELFLTWYVEKSLTKERILEIYFNVIEYGPGIYGIGRAAKHYFGTAAKDLTPRESAFFSSMLPSPKRRYAQYCKNAMDPKWDAKIDRILKTMLARDRLTDAEYQAAMASKIVFDRTEATPEKECLDMVKRITTPQPSQPVEAEDTDEDANN